MPSKTSTTTRTTATEDGTDTGIGHSKASTATAAIATGGATAPPPDAVGKKAVESASGSAPPSEPKTTGTTTRRRTARADKPSAIVSSPTSTEKGDGEESDRLWGVLRAEPGATITELALAAKLSRPRVTALLHSWRAEGSVTATDGAGRRAGQRWTAAATVISASIPAPPTAESPAAPAADVTDDAADGIDGVAGVSGDSGADETAPVLTDAPAGLGDDGLPAAGPGASGVESVQRAPVNRSGVARLAPGALGGLVEDFLLDHPGEHSPTRVATVLRRSSGAVANALERLVAKGAAIRTCDRPKRYSRASDADSATASGEPAGEETAAVASAAVPNPGTAGHDTTPTGLDPVGSTAI